MYDNIFKVQYNLYALNKIFRQWEWKWRVQYNKEIKDCYDQYDIIETLKFRRLRLPRHMAKIEKNRTALKVARKRLGESDRQGKALELAAMVKSTRARYSRINEYPVSHKPNKSKVVVITGCDSGLGYSLSIKCQELGLTVVSGCLNTKSEGAKLLKDHCFVYSLDVTKSTSVKNFSQKVKDLTEDGFHELYAVVNNAGIMIFGEFEWYTDQQIIQQVEVNMVGCFRIAKFFLPMLRKHKGRLINITSHCTMANLPTLSVYGSTKAAIQSWSEGLRLEQQKYGVKVVTFIPGSFAGSSNIMTCQDSYSKEMEESFSEDHKQFYGTYFKEFNAYLSHVSSVKKPLKPIEDDVLYKKFNEALLSCDPKFRYKHEPWRYFFYYNAFHITPTWIRDYLMKKFLKFPEFKK